MKTVILLLVLQTASGFVPRLTQFSRATKPIFALPNPGDVSFSIAALPKRAPPAPVQPVKLPDWYISGDAAAPAATAVPAPAPPVVPEVVEKVVEAAKPPPVVSDVPEIKLPDNVPEIPVPEAPPSLPEVTLPELKLPHVPPPEMKLPSIDFDSFQNWKPSLPFPEGALERPPLVQSTIDSLQSSYSGFWSSIRDSPRSPGSAPSLLEYFQSGQFKPEAFVEKLKNLPALNMQALEKMKFDQGLTADDLKQLIGKLNIDSEPFVQGAQQLGEYFKMIPVSKLSTSLTNFVEILKTEGWTSDEALQALDFDELGGWYVGTLGLLLAISSSGAGSSSRKRLELKLNATEVMLLEETKKAEAQTAALVSDKERMESQVAELSKATAAVSSELKKFQADKASSDYVLAGLKSEMRSLRNELEAQKATERELRMLLTKAENQLKDETQALKAQLAAKVAAEESLLEQVKGLEEKLSAASTLAAPKAAPVPKKATKTASEDSPVPAPAPQPTLGTFFASVEEPVAAPAPKPVSKVAKAQGASKKAPASKASAAPEESTEDWSKLSITALKRKTVKDLVEYLEAKVSEAAYADFLSRETHPFFHRVRLLPMLMASRSRRPNLSKLSCPRDHSAQLHSVSRSTIS